MAFSRRASPRLARTVVVIGVAALLPLARPTRGQQPTPQDPPVVQTTAPATTDRNTFTVVQYQFALPAAFEMVEFPQVRVVDDDGKLVELLTLLVLRRTPTWAGHRALHIESYAPGVYWVTIQFAYRRPDGTLRRVVTLARPLVVTPALPAP